LNTTEMSNQSTNMTRLSPLSRLIAQVMLVIAMCIGIVASIVMAIFTGILIILAFVWNCLAYIAFLVYDELIINRPIIFLIIFAIFIGVCVWV